jgi:hypothetical protein
MQGMKCFWKSLPWLTLEACGKNHQIILISFYRNIGCQN